MTTTTTITWDGLGKLLTNADIDTARCEELARILPADFQARAAEKLIEVFSMQTLVNEFLALEVERLQSLNRIANSQKATPKITH